MNFPVPKLTNATLDEAVAAGCDCVMLKHDGFPVTINCAAQSCNIISDFRHEEKREVVEAITLIEPLDALLVGAKSRLAVRPYIYIYDCWWMLGQDVQHLSFRERYVLARTNVKSLDDRFKIVSVVPIAQAPTLWKEVMMDPETYKGLVFRRSRDTSVGELFIRRYYKESPTAL